jgi:hypothetical protein
MIGQPPWLGEYSGRVLIRRDGSSSGSDASTDRIRSGSTNNIVESLGLNFISKAFASRKGLPPTIGYVPAVSPGNIVMKCGMCACIAAEKYLVLLVLFLPLDIFAGGRDAVHPGTYVPRVAHI